MLSKVSVLLVASFLLTKVSTVDSMTISCLEKKVRHGLSLFGGISGISYKENNNWLMVTEGLPLVFPVHLDLREEKLQPKIGQPIVLTGDPLNNELVKLESIAYCQNRLIFGTEAINGVDLKSKKTQDIRIIITNKSGEYIDDLELPSYFRRTDHSGTQFYRGIQGLSCSPDGETLLVSIQSPLLQDGNSLLGRHLIYSWHSETMSFKVEREIAVPIDLKLGVMGSTMIDKHRAIILENENFPKQQNQISLINLKEGSNNLGCFKLSDCNVSSTPKKLLVNNIESYSGVDTTKNEVQYDSIGVLPVLRSGSLMLLTVNDDDHCGTLRTNPNATIAPGFAGTTFTRIMLPETINSKIKK